jgi:predicted HTH domain antitoxin
MKAYTVRDLRDRLGEVTQTVAEGELALISRNGEPLFMAVPFSDRLLEQGIALNIACMLFSEGVLSLGQAARFVGVGKEEFLEKLGEAGIPAVSYSPDDLAGELDALK